MPYMPRHDAIYVCVKDFLPLRAAQRWHAALRRHDARYVDGGELRHCYFRVRAALLLSALSACIYDVTITRLCLYR